MPLNLAALKRLLPPESLSVDEATLVRCSGDKWFATRRPDAVVLAANAAEISATLRHATRHKIPVTTRGAGHGYVGGCVPSKGGIVLSLERMNRILEINPADFVAVVQPGVLTAQLQAEVEKLGRFYPPDPASRADCSLGGNIATNAGGPRCLKYGVTRDYVLGLEVALADGALVRLGGRTHKNKTGFDLHRLFVGSEGLLGVVTEATLKLLPLPPWRAAVAIGFSKMEHAIATLQAVFNAGLLPSALEIADPFTLKAAEKRTGSKDLAGCDGHLIIEVDGQRASVVAELELLREIAAKANPLFIQTAMGAEECERVWKIRREFSYALRDTGLTKLNEDIVVPRGSLAELFAFAAALEKRHGFQVACFGHAGDGNIHVNIMVDFNQPGAKARCDAALDDLFQKVIDLKGAITGEHGVGLAKKPWWTLAASKEVRRLHKTIKQALDPQGLLNPGKFV